ncbi:hypothetical protein VOLCADRAFT_90586 [Volvox carteri f. nagariensis]|uniref:Uncharacterized protein n=1 Tax=Volvox carteri f. nagariensis TaxID=3068 RepID=D8TUT3_VOLCA|nr:uncharacterized protein VOLCADRAFT_90586 [Volvox carteri f. nagariensis]EFJ48877.1 hypothetical protein VOLCADRAFT_90586 [Volvox carteri f. nagariensis]|eukprot:XP_002950209.1 hypothetical protein VOLCADRAFT_90586 [Volvox carteri f. nagariensis]
MSTPRWRDSETRAICSSSCPFGFRTGAGNPQAPVHFFQSNPANTPKNPARACSPNGLSQFITKAPHTAHCSRPGDAHSWIHSIRPHQTGNPTACKSASNQITRHQIRLRRIRSGSDQSIREQRHIATPEDGPIPTQRRGCSFQQAGDLGGLSNRDTRLTRAGNTPPPSVNTK